jgi:demethylmenaquinone methyltransferase/2-methoxy-6-polyprenyl-1,4-benzoquinol methylase
MTKGITEPRAWSRAELADPHRHPAKAGKVRAMFAAIARTYDLNNRLHSLGRDRAWRKTAVRLARVQTGDRVLDVACGTGDLTHAFARTPAAEIVGLDFTREMLDIAESKRRALTEDARRRVRYVEGDAQRLPFNDREFDVVSIAFGLRNVEEPERAIAEFSRVLKPGGRLVILEFDRPTLAPVRWLNAVYCGWIMPRTATLLSRDRSGAYYYLPRSVSSFLSREALASLMRDSGFADVERRPLTGGICACYAGIRVG